jgi:hypothetical protein
VPVAGEHVPGELAVGRGDAVPVHLGCRSRDAFASPQGVVVFGQFFEPGQEVLEG